MRFRGLLAVTAPADFVAAAIDTVLLPIDLINVANAPTDNR